MFHMSEPTRGGGGGGAVQCTPPPCVKEIITNRDTANIFNTGGLPVQTV